MVSTKRVQPAQFEATKWHTAERKSRFVNTLLRFINDDCPREKFTKQFYDGLYNDGHFGFIAHYDIHGFYDEQLSTPQRQASFLRELQRDCDRDAHLNRPDLWSDVKTVLRDHLDDGTLCGAARQLSPLSSFGNRRLAPGHDAPTLF